MTGNGNPQIFYRYIVVVAAFLIMAIVWGTYYSFGVFFKSLLVEFEWTRAMTSGAFSLSFILFGLLSVVAGRLTDRFGPRVAVTVGGLFLGFGYLLVSQINSIWQLYLFYGVMIAVGLSGAFVPLTSTVARWFVKRRGMMTGITLAGVSVGMLIVPPLVNWLISTYDWRVSFMVVGIIVLVLITLAAQFLKRDPGQIGQLPYGENELKEDSLELETSGFTLRQAIQTRQFWLLCIIFLCVGASLQAIIVHIIPHAVELGVSTASAAFVLSIIGAISIGSRVIIGSAADRIGNKLALIISVSLLSIALLWLLIAKDLWMLYLSAVVFGLGFGGIGALMSPMAAEYFGLSSHGVILGVITFGDTFGEAAGPVVAGHIFDVFGSYNPAFLGYAVIDVIAIMLILLLKPIGKEGGTIGP